MIEHRQSRLLQGQPTIVSGRVTTSGCVLLDKSQQNNAELVLLLEGIRLVNASMANALLSNQWDAGAGTDLI